MTSYGHPSELLALLACKDVPIERRVLYALAVYTGLRKSSLYALRWSAVDFKHRTITSLRSKTGLPQLFEVSESLMVCCARSGTPTKLGPKSGHPVVERVPTREREARVLRDDLVAAKVNRPTLLGDGGDNVQPLRFYDLRATFVTWAMREGARRRVDRIAVCFAVDRHPINARRFHVGSRGGGRSPDPGPSPRIGLGRLQ